MNVPQLRSEIQKAKQTIALFKEMLVSTSSSTSARPLSVEVNRSRFDSVRLGSRTDDKSRSLIERIGGELLLETLVELSHSRFIADSRLRAFFDLNPRKAASIKKRFLEFLIGYLGGKSSYDESNLKPAHYHLNITDYHLDAFLEILRSVMEIDLKCHPNAVQDVLSALSKVRKDIVTGYTIRSELARINTGQGIEILFRKLGGLDGVVKFIDRMYDVIAVDHRIRKFFFGSNYEAIKRGQRAYITQLIGGPRLYQDRTLEDIHKNLGIDDYYFDCFLQDAEKALTWLGTEESVIDQVLIQLESVRAPVLGRRRGVAQIIGDAQHDMLLMSNPNASFNSMLGSDKGCSELFVSNVSEGLSGPLLVQLGGEQRVEEAVRVFFRVCLDDPRLSYYFLVAQKRENSFIRSIVNVILTIAGASPARYDLTQLRGSHFNLNITDYHFDTWISNLGESCKLVGIPANAVRELLARLSKLRGEITGGCTIRLEMAQQRTESTSAAGPPMCASLGGPEGIKRVIARLYELMLADPRVSMFFRGSKVEGIIKSQGQYLANLLGAHETYTGRDIHKVHALLNVSDYHFDCFLECFSQAALDCAFSQDTADECTVLAETHRRVVVNPSSRQYSVELAFKSLNDVLSDFGFEKFAKNIFRQILSAEARSDKGIALRFLLESHQESLDLIELKFSKFVSLVSQADGGAFLKLIESDLLSVSSIVTDQHVDAFIGLMDSHLRAICQSQNVATEHVDRFLNECRALRGIVTNGYRSRRFSVLNKDLGPMDHAAVRKGLARASQDVRLSIILGTEESQIQIEKIIFGILTSPHVNVADSVEIGINEYQFDLLISYLPTDLDVVLREYLKPVLVPAQASRKRESLLVRLGGEQMVEQLVDNTIDKLTGWSPDLRSSSGMIVKSFFDIPKSRLRTFKRRITRYLISLLGAGPVHATPAVSAERFGSNVSGLSGSAVSSGAHEPSASSYLRQAHFNININDQQFDAFVQCFCESLHELGAPVEESKEFIALLESLRSEIVIGWSTRSSEARERANLAREAKYDTFYEQMGGTSTDPGLESFIGRVYELVERDKRINEFFLGSKFNYIREAQGKYIISLLGGPLSLSRGLLDVHKVYKISDYHFDCFVHDILLAARDCGASEELRDDLAFILEPFRRTITIGRKM
jgi:truncated hemoglobin YjbI